MSEFEKEPINGDDPENKREDVADESTELEKVDGPAEPENADVSVCENAAEESAKDDGADSSIDGQKPFIDESSSLKQIDNTVEETEIREPKKPKKVSLFAFILSTVSKALNELVAEEADSAIAFPGLHMELNFGVLNSSDTSYKLCNFG